MKLIYTFPTLRDAIEKLMKEFKMDYVNKEEKNIYSLRTSFIHKGKFPEKVNPVQTYNQLVHFVDRLILHILGYTKEYLDISDGYKHKKLDYKS